MAARNRPKYGTYVLLSQASTKFCKNIKIPWERANSTAQI